MPQAHFVVFCLAGLVLLLGLAAGLSPARAAGEDPPVADPSAFEQPPAGFRAGPDTPVYPLANAPAAYAWHTFYGGSELDWGHAIAVDGSGDIYVAGISLAAWTGPEGQLPLNAFAAGADYTDNMVVVKLDSAGVYQWHTFYGASGRDVGYAITVDGSGGVYVAGYSYGAWTGPSETEPLNAFAGGTDYTDNMVVVKLDSDGAYQWHTFYGSGSGDESLAIAVDGSGGVYVAGASYDTWTGPGETEPLNAWAGSADMVVVRLDSDGTYRWHTFYGGSGLDGG